MSNDHGQSPPISAVTERDETGVDGKATLRDARYRRFARRMFWRWWHTMSCDDRDAVCINLCVLPRGTASDDGWLVVR